MITRLRLKDWRAYDSLDIELGPGATFVVASNGIGKTSLVMAAAWGIFGDIAGVEGASEIRGDAASATVTTDLVLPDVGAVQIVRTVDRKGKTSLEATADGRMYTSQDDLAPLLATAFGAETNVLSQLTFMIHGGLHETQGEFELRDHLAGLFGVRPLYEAAERANAVASESASALRKMKTVERKERRAKGDLESELATAEKEVDATTKARDAARIAANEASETLRAATEWTNFRKAQDERAAKLASYAEVASSLLERTVEAASVVEVLTEWEADESSAISDLDTQAATARGRTEAMKESVATLQGADAVCPTCLRPFGDHDAERAAEEHGRAIAELEATISEAEAEAAGRRELLNNLRAILADIRSVPTPLEPTSAEPGTAHEDLSADHDAKRDAVQELDADLAVKSAAARSLREEIEAIDRESELLREISELHRTEGIALAAAQALTGTADRLMSQHIEPLVAEVARRWKQTFGREGLQLGADGRITRTVGSRELPFASLSGGERVWALLVARLLVAGASTRSPFVWLDEPLEHLDPRLRRIVAGTLAMASSRAGLRQVIVTTYEAPIAQQLMEDVPSASLVYVTSAD